MRGCLVPNKALTILDDRWIVELRSGLVKSKNNWSNGVAWHSGQARPTRGRWVPVSHELEPNQRLPLFP